MLNIETVFFQIAEIVATDIVKELGKTSTNLLAQNARWTKIAAIVAQISAKYAAKYTFTIIQSAPNQPPIVTPIAGYIYYYWHPHYQRWWWTNGYHWEWL